MASETPWTSGAKNTRSHSDHLHAGLSRAHHGIEHVEKAVAGAGAVEMSFLENGLVWLATIANIAPLLGFYGTVAGMIIAFQAIAKAGDVEPTIVANGISIALITTAGGLLVAMPTQVFYNLCVWLIDRVVVTMDESTGKLIDTLVDLGYDTPKGIGGRQRISWKSADEPE